MRNFRSSILALLFIIFGLHGLSPAYAQDCGECAAAKSWWAIHNAECFAIGNVLESFRTPQQKQMGAQCLREQRLVEACKRNCREPSTCKQFDNQGGHQVPGSYFVHAEKIFRPGDSRARNYRSTTITAYGDAINLPTSFWNGIEAQLRNGTRASGTTYYFFMQNGLVREMSGTGPYLCR